MAHRFVGTSVSVALSAAFLFAAPAFAAPDGQSAVVHTTGLDLSSDAGVQALQSRVFRAAKYVCGTPNSLDLPAMRERDSCRQVAMDSAAPQVQLAVAQARQGKTYVVANAGSSLIRLSRR
jgi:UrcA family protein